MKKLNKKAQDSGSFLTNGIVVFTIFSVVLGLILGLSLNFQKTVIPENLDELVFTTRIIYSPECFAYQETTNGRTYTGTIDSNKFNQIKLNTCLPLTSSSDTAIRIILKTQEKQYQELQTKNWNSKISGSIKTETKLVQVKNQGPGILEISFKK